MAYNIRIERIYKCNSKITIKIENVKMIQAFELLVSLLGMSTISLIVYTDF